MPPRKKKAEATLDIVRVTEEALTVHIVGTSPFVCNALSAKAQRDLLLPPKKKTRSERASTLKHEPLVEYVQSAYRSRDDEDSPTRIEFPAAGFKRAMATAALELPGVNKTQINRLCWAEGHMIPLFGLQQIWMTGVRMADKARTPDIRTRAIIPEWATTVTLRFVTPNLNRKSVGNLIASAGIFIGVGDGRPEKGALSFGQFEIVDADDERFRRIMKYGREAQDVAFEEPTPFDQTTAELLEWHDAEVKRRGFELIDGDAEEESA